jgi:hypothetical protein
MSQTTVRIRLTKCHCADCLEHGASRVRECAVWWIGNKAVFTCPFRKLIQFTANQNREFSRTKRLKRKYAHKGKMYEVGRQKSASYLTKRNTESWKFFYPRDNIYDSTQCEEFPICMNKTISSQIALRSTSMEYLMGCSGYLRRGYVVCLRYESLYCCYTRNKLWYEKFLGFFFQFANVRIILLRLFFLLCLHNPEQCDIL